MTTDWQLVVTTRDPERAACFWRAVLGYVPQPPPVGHPNWDAYARATGIDLVHGRDIDAAIDPSRRRPRLLFVRDDPAVRGAISIEVPGTQPSPARDGSITDLEARARRLVELGATWDRTVVDGSHAWIELRDPDERPFRLL